MIDKTSDTWKDIQKHIDAELNAAKIKLESAYINHEITMFNRGIVHALKMIADLPQKENVALVLTSTDYI